MCLYTKMIMPIKARHTIIVYKMLKKYDPIHYRTPIMRTDVEIGRPFTAHVRFRKFKLTPGNRIKSATTNSYVRPVGLGYVHAYTTLETAISSAKLYAEENVEACEIGCTKACVVECIIGPGTLYFKSYDGGEICARSMFLSKVVFEI